ncbi:MAG TPA: peptidoglycan-binding domain-containing protein [Acidiferrobacter sp.]|nr:peptidoglycan-binding domain-containing protein [Acidiferrobacter sp.]
MSTSIRNTLMGGAALLFAVATTVPVVALAKSAPAHKVVMHKHAMASAHVKAIQKALDKAGAKVKADGFMGKKTEAALKAFQTKHGLKATGMANKATLKALGVK